MLTRHSESGAPKVQPAARHETPSSRRGLQEAFILFSYFWGAATLFHIASYDLWRAWRLEVIVALCVLIQPGSLLALATLATVQIYETFPTELNTSNHALFAAFVNLALLASIALLALKKRHLTIDRRDLFKVLAPAVRLAVLLLYFFAVFHKLNADWFDPEVSCGRVFYAAQRSRLPFLPDSTTIDLAAIYLAIGIEATIPLLLAFRRTRHAGILVGMIFHWLLGFNPHSPFYNFSAMLVAVFALFAAPELVADSADRLGRRRVQLFSWGLASIFAGCALIGQRRFNQVIDLPHFMILFWAAYGAVLLAVFGLLLQRWNPAPQDPARFFALPQPVLALLPIVVVLNGLMPYLGLKTTATWAMFSNLRTEGGRSNHWLVPASVQMFDYQRDLVRVTQSSDRYLKTLANREELLPYFEIRRRPDASISYIRAGVEHTFRKVSDDPAFRRALPILPAAFMVFRPVDPVGKQGCAH